MTDQLQRTEFFLRWWSLKWSRNSQPFVDSKGRVHKSPPPLSLYWTMPSALFILFVRKVREEISELILAPSRNSAYDYDTN
jgi:hypothetical protein